MILILSDDSDFSTNVVIDWIHYLGGKSIRLNDNDIVHISSLSISSDGNSHFKATISGDKKKEYILLSNNISSYWYRRGPVPAKLHFVGNNM